jgi:sugar lactone lactonase YvrE
VGHLGISCKRALCVFLVATSCLAPALIGQSPNLSDVAIARRVETSPSLPLVEKHLALHASRSDWEIGAVSGVAADRDGNLLVMQRGAKADPILVFDRRGNLLRSWGKGDFTLPHSLRIDTLGNIWALDAGASKVLKYSPMGKKLLTISVAPVPDTGSPFRGVTDIAFAPSGDLYITDGYGNARILEYTAKGSKVREWGHAGTASAEFHLPHAIQIGPDGTIYVADRENGRIEKFDLNGNFLGAIDRLGRCYGLVLDHGVLWASMSPMAQDPGSPGWIVKLDPRSGTILGHVNVPDQRQGHALNLLKSGDLVITAGQGLILFSPQ